MFLPTSLTRFLSRVLNWNFGNGSLARMLKIVQSGKSSTKDKFCIKCGLTEDRGSVDTFRCLSYDVVVVEAALDVRTLFFTSR